VNHSNCSFYPIQKYVFKTYLKVIIKIKNMNCPTCNKPSAAFCDNDCETRFCGRCQEDFYKDDNGSVIRGHNPKCGDESDIETGDEAIEDVNEFTTKNE
jgi:hypothetical protein